MYSNICFLLRRKLAPLRLLLGFQAPIVSTICVILLNGFSCFIPFSSIFILFYFLFLYSLGFQFLFLFFGNSACNYHQHFLGEILKYSVKYSTSALGTPISAPPHARPPQNDCPRTLWMLAGSQSAQSTMHVAAACRLNEAQKLT